MRLHFVLSFLLMALLAAVLGVNWWLTLTKLDLPWLAIPLAGFAVLMTLLNLFWALEAATAD